MGLVFKGGSSKQLATVVKVNLVSCNCIGLEEVSKYTSGLVIKSISTRWPCSSRLAVLCLDLSHASGELLLTSLPL